MTATASPTDRTGWPRVSPIRRIVARVRAWICGRVCDGYDRRAGRIVDALTAEVERLHDQPGTRYPGGAVMSAPIDIAAAHRERIGCSLVAQALGLSQFGTAYQLWAQYTGRAEWPDIGDDLRVALGEPMEDVLRPFVAARLGRDLRRDRREYLHPDLPLIGHVDYRAERLAGESKRPVVDMKTSLGFGARHRFGEDGSDEVDDGVLLQMQGYTMLTGAEIAYVAALVPGPELKILTIPADL